MTRFYAFPVDPLSVNDAYAMNYGRRGRDRRLTDDARKYKEKIKHWMEITDNKFYGFQKLAWEKRRPWFIVEWAFLIPQNNFFSKNGTSDHPNAKDVSNYFKLAEDAVAEYTGINDTHNIIVTGMKTLSEYAGITVPMICFTVTQVTDLPSFNVPAGFEAVFEECKRNYSVL